MWQVRRSQTRGLAEHGWLSSRHSFSFADYYDPQHMGFGVLRVINEDRVLPGKGFGTHSHRDMEILSYVLDGELEHRDSMGNGSIIVPGDVQRMSAGSGVTHSERNPSSTEPVHFLQIWILPQRPGGAPGYEQRHFDAALKRGRLVLVAAPAGTVGAVGIQQDVRLWAGMFDGAEQTQFAIPAGRSAYLHVARGALSVNGLSLEAGDALEMTDAQPLQIQDGRSAELLIFDLPHAGRE